MSDRLLVPFNESKYIVCSSTLFLYPSYLAYSRGLYIHSAILLFTSLIAINYWRNATDCWRRHLDLFWAKATFVIYGTYGVYYIRNPYTLYIFCQNIYWMGYFYNTACQYHGQNEKKWIIYHILFHLFATYDLNLAINALPVTSGTQRNP